MSEPPQRYCRNCGAEIRSDTRFCVSCGAGLVAGQPGSGYANSGPGSSGSTPPFADSLLGKLRGLNMQERFSGARRWLSGHRPNLDAGSVLGIPARARGWFGRLHPVIKMLLAGAVLLVLVVLLSPVMRVVAIIAFLVSAAFLILNGVQRRFAPRWAVAAASSLALIFVFGGISGAVYGPAETASGPDPARTEPADTEPAAVSSPEGSTSPSAGASEPDLPVPVEVGRAWASEVPDELYILVPTYLPFEPEDYTDTFGQMQYPTYNMSAEGEMNLEITVEDAFLMVAQEPGGTIEVDGRTYYYELVGYCSLNLWETSDAQPAFSMTVALSDNVNACVEIEDEWATILESMVRVEGTGGEGW